MASATFHSLLFGAIGANANAGGLVGLGRASSFLDHVHLGAGDGGGGDEGAVLGADERQVALGVLGAVFGGLELALEAAHPGHGLLRHALLPRRERVNIMLLRNWQENAILQCFFKCFLNLSLFCYTVKICVGSDQNFIYWL